jgi:hypothetical protein
MESRRFVSGTDFRNKPRGAQKVGRFYSARVGIHHRAVGVETAVGEA